MPEANARRMAILELVAGQRVVRVAELSRRFGVSEVSIRRDLAWLREYGLLRRVHGGAVSGGERAFEPPYQDRLKLHLEEKQRIGRAAAALVQAGERVIFDSGTTVLEIARALAASPRERGQITAITASLPSAVALAHARLVHLIMLGGIFQPESETFVGPQTLSNLDGLHADRLFLGADGLSLDDGLASANVLEAEVSRAMVRAAREVVIVADASKINRVGLASIMPLERASRLVTDSSAPAEFVAALRARGVEVTLA
ncbi:MAG: DeoR/GlpR family DNA-binding transcription regulator [Anaerolineae bacterium]